MVTSFLKWSKERLLNNLLGRINEHFLNYFVNLPGSVSFGGFMDKLELNNVCVDTSFLSGELQQSGVPVRVKYGHIGRIKIHMYLSQSASHVVLEDVSIILGTQYNWLDLKATIASKLKAVSDHVIEVVQTLTANKSSSSSHDNLLDRQNEDDVDKTTWLLRYSPNIVVTIRNLHVRYEDDLLFDSFACGFVWDSFVLRPNDRFWDFEWADTTDHQNKASFKSPPTDQSARKANNNNNRSDEQTKRGSIPSIDELQAERCSIYAMTIKGVGVYFNTVDRQWIPHTFLVGTDTIKGAIYKLLPFSQMRQIIQIASRDLNWIVRPFDLSCQFGMEHIEFDGLSNADIRKDKRSGRRILLRMFDPVQVHVDQAVVIKLVYLYWTEVQSARWRQLRKHKTCLMMSQNTALESERRLLARHRWEYCKHYISLLRIEHGVTSIRDEVNERVSKKRRFCSIIRQSLLQYHLTHPKGYAVATQMYPYIDTCFRILSSHFIFQKSGEAPIDTDPLYVIGAHNASGFLSTDNRYIPFRDVHVNAPRLNWKNRHRMHDATHTISTEIVCCTQKDFEENGLTACPLGYFIFLPPWILLELSKTNKDAKLLVDILASRAYTTTAQWYLLAVRETEEILALSKESWMHGVDSLMNQKYLATTQCLVNTISIDSFNIKKLIHFLDYDKSFIALIRQRMRQLEGSRMKKLSSTIINSSRLHQSPFWKRGRRKLEVVADFYESYVSSFRGIHCENVNLGALFQFSDLLSRKKSSSVISSEFLDATLAKPATKLKNLKNESHNSHHRFSTFLKSIESFVKDLKQKEFNKFSNPDFDAELKPKIPSFLKSLSEGGGYTIAKIILTGSHIDKQHPVMSPRKTLKKNLFGIRVMSFASSFSLRRKLSFSSICQHIQLFGSTNSRDGVAFVPYVTISPKECASQMTEELLKGLTASSTLTSTTEVVSQQQQQSKFLWTTTPLHYSKSFGPTIMKSIGLHHSIKGDLMDCEFEESDEKTQTKQQHDQLPIARRSDFFENSLIEVDVFNGMQKLPERNEDVWTIPSHRSQKLLLNPEWSFFRLNFMTRSFAKDKYTIELPFFLEVNFHLTDVTVSRKTSEFFHQFYDYLTKMVSVFNDTSTDALKKFGTLDWTKENFLIKVSPISFPTTTQTNSLKFHIDNKPTKNGCQCCVVDSNFTKQTTRERKNVANRLEFAIQRSHISIKINLPKVFYKSESSPPSCYISPDILVLLTTQKKDDYFFVLKTLRHRFIFAKDWSNIPRLLETVSEILSSRYSEVFQPDLK